MFLFFSPLLLPSLPHSLHRGYREKGLYKALQKNKEMVAKLLDPATLEDCDRTFTQLEHQVKAGEEERERMAEEEEKEEERGKRMEDEEEEEEDESTEDGESDSETESADSSSEADEMDASSGPDAEPPLNSGHTTLSTNDMPSSDDHGTNLTNGLPPSDHVTNPTNGEVVSRKSKTTDQITNNSHESSHMPKPGGVAEPRGMLDPEFPSCIRQAMLQLVSYVDGMSERLTAARLYTDSLPEDMLLATLVRSKDISQPLAEIGSTLLRIEGAVDRRYLKPPLRDR